MALVTKGGHFIKGKKKGEYFRFNGQRMSWGTIRIAEIGLMMRTTKRAAGGVMKRHPGQGGGDNIGPVFPMSLTTSVLGGKGGGNFQSENL